MRSGDALGKHRRGRRLYRHHLYPGVFVLEIFPNAGDGAAGADTGHKDIHPAVGILPDLRPGGLPMGGGIGRIDKLAGEKAVRDLLCQRLCLFDGAPHALGALGEHQLRAVGLHDLAALHAHGLGHDDDDPIAPGGGHSGQADAGVAGGGLDDDRAGLQQTPPLCVVDHRFSHPVLDASRRVQIFQLCQQTGLQALRLLDMGQLQQRCPADELIHSSIDPAHNRSLQAIN